MRYVISLAIIIVLLTGCGNDSAQLDHSGKGDPVMGIDDEDREMNDAMVTARETVGEFIKELHSPSEDKICMIKMPIDNEGQQEHIWIDNVKYKNGRFIGNLANVPNSPKYEQGDEVSIEESGISDWVVLYENGKQLGGYTLEVMEKRMRGN